VKFSVKSVYPISTSLRATSCRTSWELATMEVEYLFMGDGSRNRGQITEGNYVFRYLKIGVLNAKPQTKQAGGTD
jgi:hypothetical protein